MNRKSYALKRISWIDLETTGFDPYQGEVLEVALVITDGFYEEIDSFEVVIKHDPERLRMGKWCWENHQNLLAKCFYEVYGVMGIDDADRKCAELIKKADAKGCPIGGSSPDFDRGFLRHHMPITYDMLSHQVHDVSTFMHYVDTRGIELCDDPSDHRAMSDIRRSISRARLFDKFVRGEK